MSKSFGFKWNLQQSNSYVHIVMMYRMLADEVNDHTASLVDECPMLIEEDDTEIATTSNVAACRNGFTITRGPEMYTLWDTLQAVANDDDGNHRIIVALQICVYCTTLILLLSERRCRDGSVGRLGHLARHG